MTSLSLAIRNLLAQDTQLRALLGRSLSWDTWVFDTNPVNVRVENTGKCLIVVSEEGTWTFPNQHNTMRFPKINVDIWADPTRNSDRTIQLFNAETKIEEIQKLVDAHLHLVDPSTSAGMPYIWGTADEIAAQTGVLVVGSQRLSGPDIYPIQDSEGSFMGRIAYGVNLP